MDPHGKIRDDAYQYCNGVLLWARDEIKSKVESPIEELFGCAYATNSRLSTAIIFDVMKPRMSLEEVLAETKAETRFGSLPTHRLAPQVIVAEYRVDFLVVIARGSAISTVAVECDGFNFHDRTPQLAARDKSRDRTLLMHVDAVLRFTGSELYRDPPGCAAEAFKTAWARLEGKI